MSWSRWVGFWVLSFGLGACDARRGPEVQVFSESVRPKNGERATGDSALFDGGSLSLRASRGETLGLLVRLSGQSKREVSLWLPSAGALVQAFAVRSLQVKEPSTGMYGPSRGRGVYPEILVPVAGAVETESLAYFDLGVPADAPPGRYVGRLAIGSQAVPLVLDVGCGRIDLEREPLVWAFYLPGEIARAHRVPDDDGPAQIAIERRYVELMREHGVLLASDLGPGRFEARRSLARGARFWPVAVDTRSEHAIEADVRRWLEVFHDGGTTPFTIPLDEPRTPERRKLARRIAEVIGRAGGGRPRLLRAVTDRASPDYGDAMDVFVSPANFPDAASRSAPNGVRYWTYNGRPPGAGSMVLDAEGPALRTWGWIAERYGVELWYAWESTYFSDRYNGGGPTEVMTDPVTFDERSRGGADFGNGDGLLVYPGPLPSLRLKVLRRGLSDRLLLRELVACGRAERARQIVERVIPRALGAGKGAPAWPADDSGWERSRREVLDGIEECCRGG